MTNTEPATITAEQLAELSSLTPPKIYQLADEKIIPTASNGRFPMLESIRALFQYFQTGERQFPTLDSMQNAAGALGVPLSIIKAAKRDGCDAFRLGSRVDAKILGPYLFKKILTDAKSVMLDPVQEKAQLDREKRIKLEDEKRIRQGAMHDRAAIEKAIWFDCLSPLRQMLLSMPNQIAPLANPDDPATAQKVLSQWTDNTLAKIQAGQPADATPEK